MSPRANPMATLGVRAACAVLWCSVLCCSVLWCAGCAQTVTVKVDGPHTAARFGETALGEVPAAGKPVEVPVGMSAVPYEVERGGEVVRGQVARTEPNPWLLTAAIGGVVCCVPSALALGFCVANPGVLVAAPLVLVGIGDLGAVTAGCVAPSWFTLPVLSGCGAIGLAPAAAALWADAPPGEVVLPAPAPATAPEAPTEPAPSDAAPSDAAPIVGMAW